MRTLTCAHLSEVTVVSGADDYSGLSIEETMRRSGTGMTLLLRVSRHIWDDHGWPFRERYEASQIPQDCWDVMWIERWGPIKESVHATSHQRTT